MTAEHVVKIRPQEGPQFKFINSRADIVIYGGGAGGADQGGEAAERETVNVGAGGHSPHVTRRRAV